MTSAFSFAIEARHGMARAGRLMTPHGVIETPAFIFCATKAAIRVATPQTLREEGTQIILGNTYHLMLQPGSERVAELGGLQQFTGWRGPMLTDSGGFQIFSLGHGTIADEIKGKRDGKYPKTLIKISEEGAEFRSYIDGRKHRLTPESAITVQQQLGADLILVLDECTPFHVDRSYTERSLARTNRWGVRSLREFQRTDSGQQALYGIVQGGVYEDLRYESAGFVAEQPFFGQAVGGSLGSSREQMYEVVGWSMAKLDPLKPTHLLGIGGVRDIWEGVERGVDTFDCVHPTRLARHGGALAVNARERLNLRNAAYASDTGPLDAACGCYTCQTVSRGYLHHLVKSGEPLGYALLALHNIRFMNDLMRVIRQSLFDGTFAATKRAWLARLEAPAEELESMADAGG